MIVCKRVLTILNEPVVAGAADVRVPVETTEFVLRVVDAAGVPVTFDVAMHDATDMVFHFRAGDEMKEGDLVLFDDLVLRVTSAGAVVEVRVWGQ